MRQVIVDAPLLLRRLVSDLRCGDLQVFHELIRRGFQLKLLVGAFYIFSPVRKREKGWSYRRFFAILGARCVHLGVVGGFG